MRSAYLVSTLISLTTILASGLANGLVPGVGRAVRLGDGQVYFTRPPYLVSASTTRTQTYAWNATYYFTLTVPEDAGEPLQKVAIAQRDGSTAARRISYDLDETIAFLGTRRQREASLTLGTTLYDRDTQTITVTFTPPVPPGNTVTIGLRPERNPQLDGLYLLGVTAFPAGEPAYGQFLGFGRFQFDAPDQDFLF